MALLLRYATICFCSSRGGRGRNSNIVVVASFRGSIYLEESARKHEMIYEPEQFPGGIMGIEEPYKATVLLFASGKAVISGLKSSSQINPILQKIEN